jgi:hypothetical protein
LLAGEKRGKEIQEEIVRFPEGKEHKSSQRLIWKGARKVETRRDLLAKRKGAKEIKGVEIEIVHFPERKKGELIWKGARNVDEKRLASGRTKGEEKREK